MKYTVYREVEEWIEIEAEDSEVAVDAASEMPIEEWTREVHDQRVIEDG